MNGAVPSSVQWVLQAQSMGQPLTVGSRPLPSPLCSSPAPLGARPGPHPPQHRPSAHTFTLSVIFFFFLMLWPHSTGCGVLTPRPGTSLHWKHQVFSLTRNSPALETLSLNYWTTREVPQIFCAPTNAPVCRDMETKKTGKNLCRESHQRQCGSS